MPADLLVRGGRLVTPDGTFRADIAVEEGRIADIARELSGSAMEEIDARGLHVFPGLIDMHVHFNEPGRAHWEGLATGSAALAAGGGTLFADMPLNSSPPVLDRAGFMAKKAAAEAASLTDFALWGGLTPGNPGQLAELAELGVVGFKAFMADSGLAEYPAADDLTLFEGMRQAAQFGLPVAVHAESEALTRGLAAKLRAAGGASARDFLASRPVLAELEAVSRALLFAEETGAQVHLVHLSTARAVRLVGEARRRGVRASCETCPHYLHFGEDDLERLGAVLKCAPPLRSASERAALWDCVVRGEVDLVASDHSPCSPEDKDRTDFFEVWGGVAGVQSTLGVLLTGGPEQGLALEAVAALTSANPAVCFGLAAKGRLEPGYDADLALVDLEASYVLEPEMLLNRHKQSPYLGQRFRGRVRRTLLRGRTIYLDGRIAPHGSARLLRPRMERTAS